MKKITKSNSENKRQWRSLEQLENSPESQSFLEREFPVDASILDPVSRRTFLKLMGASVALAGVAGCTVRKPVQKIFPFTKTPESMVPGRPLYFATTMAVGEDVVGLLAETFEGRPTKMEGNPAHPWSLGAASAFHQASVLELYDPDRLKTVMNNGQPSAWEGFDKALSGWRGTFESNEGEGLAILTEGSASPSFFALVEQMEKDLPNAKIYRYDAVNRDNLIQGLHSASGRYITPDYHFENADIVVSFGSDFLGPEVGSLRYTREFAKRRHPDHTSGMNRLYAFEHTVTLTGAKADHRFRLRAHEIEGALWLVAQKLLQSGLSIGKDGVEAAIRSGAKKYQNQLAPAVVDAIAEDLKKHKGRSLLLAGVQQGPTVHGLIYLIHLALGSIGNVLSYRALNFSKYGFVTKSNVAAMESLCEALAQGKISHVLILGGNPVYNAPADLKFAEKLQRAKNRVHLTLFANETSALCHWVLPRTHYLESWGDARAIDGATSLVQPVIRPLYGGRSELDVFSQWLGRSDGGNALVKKTWQNLSDKSWRKALHEGLVSAPSEAETGLKYSDSGFSAALSRRANSAPIESLEIVFMPDYKLLDGRFSNNGWLQELPDPITKLTWDNAALISIASAKKWAVKNGDMIEIENGERSVQSAVMIAPGHADNSVSLFLGYGRKESGRIGKNVGFDVFPLRSTRSAWMLAGANVKKLGETYQLATTQEHWSIENKNANGSQQNGRPIYREADIEEYRKNPEFAKEMVESAPLKSLWNEKKYDTGYQWGLSIDLAKCTGCNACITACQSENNIPIVGKDQVARGREMQWIRLDRYYEGDPNDPRILEQPVTCLQCEMAPCESVCPVAATAHSSEGLNDMTYNRCVGTRYCSNNCPVKVRRFNFYDYHQRNPQSIKKERVHLFDYMREPDKATQMQFNPNVTVRMRGMMEKCTYCVQRINEGKSVAKNENRSVVDGDIKTACQQTCPAEAIVFGNILEKTSRVAKLKSEGRNYDLLSELNLKPRTSYLANIRNPHPKLAATDVAGVMR